MSLQAGDVVGVVGAGQMGNGIAQVAASFGLSVIMMDVSASALEKGMSTISSSCDRLIKKGTMTEEQKKTLLSKIQTVENMQGLKNADIVIEAATENVDLKLKIFRELDQVVKKEALLVSNTSSISIAKIGGRHSWFANFG